MKPEAGYFSVKLTVVVPSLVTESIFVSVSEPSELTARTSHVPVGMVVRKLYDPEELVVALYSPRFTVTRAPLTGLPMASTT